MTGNIDHEDRPAATRRHKWGTAFVLISVVVAVTAGVGFLIVYWTGGSNLLLGGTLAFFLGGLGWMLVLWSHWLMPHKEVVEPREALPSEAADLQALSQEFFGDEQATQRRKLLKGLLAAGTGIIGAMVISLIRSVAKSPFPTLSSTVWKRGQRLMMLDGNPVSVQALKPGSTVLVFPEGRIGD